jgi:hypothetical protein
MLKNMEQNQLQAVVAAIQADVGKLGIKDKQVWGEGHGSNNALLIAENYPKATQDTPGNQIGVILDELNSVVQLTSINKINPPNKLYWVQITSYDGFKEFLEQRGIPAYVSFGNQLKQPDQKRGTDKPTDCYDCAKLLCKECASKKLKQLPQTEVHNPLITKKGRIELLLMEYSPNTKYK